MSGIAGILRRDGRPIEESWATKLGNSLSGTLWRFEESVEISAGTAELVLISETKIKNESSIGDENASAIWDRDTLELHLHRTGNGKNQLYFLDLDEAGDGIVFCSNPMPLLNIAKELELVNAHLVSATQQYLQLGFVTGKDSLLSPVQSVPLQHEMQYANCKKVDFEIDRSSSVAEDLIALVTRIGLPFSDYTLLSKLWMYRNASSKGNTICDGLQDPTARIKDTLKFSRWQGMLSQLPHQKKARDWSKYGITTFDSVFSSSLIEQLTGQQFALPVNPQYRGSIEEQLELYDREVHNPDSIFRGMDAAADIAHVELQICSDGGLPIESYPISSWLRSPQSSLGQLAGDTFTSEDAFCSLPIDKSVVLELFTAHNQESQDFTSELFSLLTLSLWSSQVRA